MVEEEEEEQERMKWLGKSQEKGSPSIPHPFGSLPKATANNNNMVQLVANVNLNVKCHRRLKVHLRFLLLVLRR